VGVADHTSFGFQKLRAPAVALLMLNVARWAMWLLQWLLRLFGTETAWWDTPEGIDMLGDLRPASRKQCEDALAGFWGWQASSQALVFTRRELDSALTAFMRTCTRHQATTLVAAIKKRYPYVRYQLPLATAYLKIVAYVQPVRHHPPLPWSLAVGMCFVLAQAGMPRRGLALLVQWRFGLRPSELLALGGDDIFLPGASWSDLAFIRLGRRRGTKIRRPQVARARGDDPWARWLLTLCKLATVPGARLSDLTSYPVYARSFRLALLRLGLDEHWTPRSPRAGWATWKWSSGVSFEEIREDGRWQTDSSCRVYLDTVAAAETLGSTALQAMLPWLHDLETSLHVWLPQFLRINPYDLRLWRLLGK